MSRQKERIKYAMSFKGKDMENEELKENIQLAILDGAVWADKTMIDKACQWLKEHFVYRLDMSFIEDFRKAMEN